MIIAIYRYNYNTSVTCSATICECSLVYRGGGDIKAILEQFGYSIAK